MKFQIRVLLFTMLKVTLTFNPKSKPSNRGICFRLSKINEIAFNQYDVKRVSFQTKIGLNLEDPVFTIGDNVTSGSDLRKSRKRQHNDKPKKKIDSKQEAASKRFLLGNGVGGLTPEALIHLIHTAAPYIFSVGDTDKLTLGEDFDFDNDDSQCTSSSIQAPAPRMHTVQKDTPLEPWESILNDAHEIPVTDHPSEDDRVKYFKLCLAAHFSSVASFVPTDVDSKIRGHCWFDPSVNVLERQVDVLMDAMLWNPSKVSRRIVYVDNEIVSGHNGEWLGVLVGAWGAMLRIGKMSHASELESLIDSELRREADCFNKLCKSKQTVQSDTILLKLSAILTHNVGDVDQGLSYWANETVTDGNLMSHNRFARLAHESYQRYDGLFGQAKRIYSQLLSAEGHRNYPLREAKCLRKHFELQLPLSPWLENWGRAIGTHPKLTYSDRVAIIKQLLRGCDSDSKAWCVPNQIGYYRALHGISSTVDLEKISRDLDKDCRRVLKEHNMRLHLDLSDEAFASRLGRQAREILHTS